MPDVSSVLPNRLYRALPATSTGSGRVRQITATASGKGHAWSLSSVKLQGAPPSWAAELLRDSLHGLDHKERLAFWQERILKDEALAVLRRTPTFERLADENHFPN